MRKSVFISVLACLACVMLAAACNHEEISGGLPAQGDFDIRVVARPTAFQTIDVGTRGLKTDDEKKVTSMTMFIVDNNGNVVSRQHINSASPLFSLVRSDLYSKNTNISAARIFVIANYPDNNDSRSVRNLDDLHDLDFELDEIGIPENGFPMLGKNNGGTIDLRPDEQGGTLPSGSVLDVTLYSLYAKVVFNISVDPIQTSEHKQKFTMDACTVHNIPSQIEFREPLNSATAHKADIIKDGTDNKIFEIDEAAWTSNKAVESGSTISFTFYMPEHQVVPQTSTASYSYPWGSGEYLNANGVDIRQHYKPLLLGDQEDCATFVELHGIYNDHNNKDYDVKYRIYLGEDNYGNFFIGRDKQLNNSVKITGATNSNTLDNLGTVSYDHRVDISATKFKFALERETLLDAHWEIRPIRIALNRSEYPDAKIKVQVLEPGTNGWIRLEMPASPSDAAYCSATSSDLAYGKRRYFTTDLVTNTLASGSECTISPATPGTTTVRTLASGDTEYTIWTYIDENQNLEGIPEDGGCTTRNAVVRCEFWEDGDETNMSSSNYVQTDYTFTQRSLYRINYGGRTYYIEDYEEYLFNFDAHDTFETTTDGMEWGLDGEQLSYEDRAIYFEGGIASGIVNYFISGIDQNLRVYDFYLTKEESADGEIEHPYSGRRFTKRIAKKVGISQLATNALPSSAIEYCVNKNKRLSGSGAVDMKTLRWYMPAIDEIEDICMGGYSYFEVFQDKYYWSSQPAYQVYNWTYTSLENNGRGMMFLDNKSRARATKVNNEFHTDNSGQDLSSAEFSYSLTRPFLSGTVDVDGPNATGNTPKFDPGNQPRSTVNRIRCAYKEVKRVDSVFGFESGTTDSNWTADNFSRNNGDHRTGGYAGYSNGSSTTMTSKLIEAPMLISFYVKHSGSYSATWAVAVSTDGSNWTTIQNNISDTASWTEISVDLSGYEDIYIRITSTSVDYDSGWFSTEYAKRYIDDITLTYYE